MGSVVCFHCGTSGPDGDRHAEACPAIDPAKVGPKPGTCDYCKSDGVVRICNRADKFRHVCGANYCDACVDEHRRECDLEIDRAEELWNRVIGENGTIEDYYDLINEPRSAP